MSAKNYMEYNDAEAVLTPFANEIKKRAKQFGSAPTYEETALGDIIQYTGATTNDFTHGYFYERTSNGWEQINTQPGAGTIPTALADLTDDSTHRLVTDTEKTDWNSKMLKHEFVNRAAFPAEGDTKDLYIAQDTNAQYRWNGTTYVELSPAATGNLELGNSHDKAFWGDYGQSAYDHATESGKIDSAQPSSLYKIGVTSEGHVASVTPVNKNDIVGLGIPGQDTTYEPAINAPADVAQNGAVGDSARYARENHTHGISVATGDNNGQVKIAGQNADVKGLQSGAFTKIGVIPVNPADTTGLNIWIETE